MLASFLVCIQHNQNMQQSSVLHVEIYSKSLLTKAFKFCPH